ncbi:tetratricopeptide repeat protein [Paenibacillus thermotolerans]|uniref:tetratricopeptide repeat protein n=1 Tax=Paenibacillus thermotolerans TaxID=3027807 RepID=UPI0023687600|nr:MULTISPECIES: SEC-C metal-binding domain-containing protein [unclassified Paenibacillus]
MALPGRNEPCHCGSGKKYKKCCLDKDKQTGGTLAPDKPLTIESLHGIVDHELPWENELYRITAHFLLNRIDTAYGIENIRDTVFLWNEYANTTMPIYKKHGTVCAALDYFTAFSAGNHVTQSDIAQQYNVSAATVSKRFNELMDYLDGEYGDFDSDALDNIGMSKGDTEQVMREIQQQLGERQFETMEEAQAFISAYMQSRMDGHTPVKPAKSPKTSSKRDQAQDLIYKAINEPSPLKKVRLAREALHLYPNSPDAYLLLAEEATSGEEVLQYLQKGLAAGENDLGEAFFKENEGYFWGLIETRPYMRVKYNYAETCWQMGNSGEARKHLEHILKLNPMDNMGARYLLAAVYLYEDELEQAERLLEQFDESTASFMYDRVVLEYKKRGINPTLKMAYRGAKNSNRFVPKYLLGEKTLPTSLPEFYGIGDENEAVMYVESHARLWIGLPELLTWMSKQK